LKTKILYAEDEPFLAQIVQESLQSRGFDVRLVSHGTEAAAAFEAFGPDICVLDIMLPGKNGYDIAKAIRQQQPHLPLIFLTAKSQTEDLLKGFEAGGNDYLKKPFSMEELIVRIQNLLRISGNTPIAAKAANDCLELGRYRFYPQRYELQLEGQVRKLSFKENSLLQLLAESINQPIERKEILLKLWGDDSFYNSRNLDVYITKLRECLRDDPSIEIVTIKGVGYHLVVK
jgi:DNA-binding response OmpR family regulator